MKKPPASTGGAAWAACTSAFIDSPGNDDTLPPVDAMESRGLAAADTDSGLFTSTDGLTGIAGISGLLVVGIDGLSAVAPAGTSTPWSCCARFAVGDTAKELGAAEVDIAGPAEGLSTEGMAGVVEIEVTCGVADGCCCMTIDGAEDG